MALPLVAPQSKARKWQVLIYYQELREFEIVLLKY
jgi:hypothetical protein